MSIVLPVHDRFQSLSPRKKCSQSIRSICITFDFTFTVFFCFHTGNLKNVYTVHEYDLSKY